MARAVETLPIAVSIDASVTVAPKLNSDELTSKVVPEPKRSRAETVIVSPSSAPTWKFSAALPVSSEIPLNLVWAEMREISSQSCATSFVIAA